MAKRKPAAGIVEAVEDTTRADIIALQEKIKSLEARIRDHEEYTTTKYATREYIQTYIEQMLGDFMPIDNPFTENTSFIGYVPLDIERTLKHFKNIGGAYTFYDYRSILISYDDTAKQGNINSYLLVAQMVKETDWGRSWWSQRPRRNPAGIGVTGETSIEEPQNKSAWAFDNNKNIWKKGYSFPSWKVATQAHAGHLLAYAYKDNELTNEQLLLIVSDPRARFIPEVKRGTIKLLKDLDGNWAFPGVGYGKSIATIANALRT